MVGVIRKFVVLFCVYIEYICEGGCLELQLNDIWVMWFGFHRLIEDALYFWNLYIVFID